MDWNLKTVLLSLTLLISAPHAFAQNVNGVLRVVKGDVQIKSGKSGELSKARLGAQVFPKDVIITGKESRAKIVMVDNNELNVSPESQIEIQHYEFDPAAGKKDVLLNVIYGKVRSKVEQKYDGRTSKFMIKTPSAVAGVRGTDFLTSYDRGTQSSQITTFTGKVEFGTPGPGGTITQPVFVSAGTQASNVSGQAPSPPAAVPREQLAKLDNDSKAEGAAPASSGKNEQRQPSSEKKDDAKKDDTKSSDDGAKKSDAGKADDGGKKAEGAKSGDGGKTADTSKANGSGDSTKSSNTGTGAGTNPGTGRQPAGLIDGPKSNPVAATEPKSGGCEMCGPPIAPPPPVIPGVATGGSGCPGGLCVAPPPPTVIPVCDFCNQQIQNGRSKVIINVRQQ